MQFRKYFTRGPQFCFPLSRIVVLSESLPNALSRCSITSLISDIIRAPSIFVSFFDSPTSLHHISIKFELNQKIILSPTNSELIVSSLLCSPCTLIIVKSISTYIFTTIINLLPPLDPTLLKSRTNKA